MSTLVIYHKNCMDGTTAAAVAKEAIERSGHTVELLAAAYGDAPPPRDTIHGRHVYIVDFSYPRETLLTMYEDALDLLVLDHHKTAAADLADLPFAEFDMDRSGAGMAWDNFNPGKARPPLVKYVEDRDLWRFAHGDETRFFCAVVQADFNRIEDADDKVIAAQLLLQADNEDVHQIMNEGRILVEHFNGIVDNIEEQGAYLVNLLGTDCSCINAPGIFASELGNALVKHHNRPALVWYCDGQIVKGMLRSADHLPDVSAIARAFGGGGHRNAAGFRAGLLFLNEIGQAHQQPEPEADAEPVAVWDVRDGDKPPVAP